MDKVVYDLEQFPNFHSGVFYDIDLKTKKIFALHQERDERIEYFNYLIEASKTVGMIGFNNLDYDYPMLHYILTNTKKLLSIPIEECLTLMYAKSQYIIDSEYPAISHWNVRIKQLDLFRIHHFNNVAKYTSLKHLQMAMHWHNLQEMPFHYTHMVTKEEISQVLEYNDNDVMSTYQFYLESSKEIQFRKRISKQYNINCMNYPDVKIGEEILIIENAKALNIPIKEFRKLRTERDFIKLKECVLPSIRFKSKEFNKALDYFKSKTVHAMNTKNVLDYTVIYGGVKYDFGGGGIHGTCGSGVFRSDNEGDLILVDVSSYYPNLAIQNKFFPKHLSKKFCDVGLKLYNERMEAKKIGDNEAVAGIKLALNGALFGKSNDEHSPMYDTKFMFDITINGQLLLCMLAEKITDVGIKIIQINTDGILVKVSKAMQIELKKICEKWENLTKLKLDYDLFKVIIQRDVNNYSGTFTDNTTKEKGAFAIDKPWHKNHSMKVVSIAVAKYFVDGIPVENTIKNHTEIYDFCISQKVGKQYTVEHHYLKNNNLIKEEIQRLNRFFITNSGGALVKVKKDSSVSRLTAGHSIGLFNKFYKSDNYDLKYNYYIAEANKLINAVDNGQISMF